VKAHQGEVAEASAGYAEALEPACANMEFMVPSIYRQMLTESSYISLH